MHVFLIVVKNAVTSKRPQKGGRLGKKKHGIVKQRKMVKI